MHRTSIILAIVVVGLAGIAQAADRPNVLFLFTDDQRADTIGALGNDLIQTPNIDRLIDEGFTFHNAYCMGSTSGAVCLPSRHMMHSGMSLFRYDTNKREGTFGDVMRKAGFETYHQSKSGNTPHNYHTAFEHSSYLNDEQERTSGQHGRTVANHAITFLEKTWKKDRPFFMYLGFAGPHDPRVADQAWLDLYEQDAIPLPKNYAAYHPFDNGEMYVRDERLAPWPRTENIVRKHLRDYYACITSIDHNIGRIVSTLEALGEFDNTIVVFSSDHGLAIGSHGLFGKQNLYEHSMKAPLVFSGPGIPHGQSEAFGYLMDIFPTVVELIGQSPPSDIDGKSLAPVIRGERNRARESIYLAYKDVQRAVRKADWKLIRYPKVDVTQLFNLASDPNETNNLADDPAHAERVAEMMTLLAARQKAFDDPAPLRVAHPNPAEVDETFFQRAPKVKKRRQPRKK